MRKSFIILLFSALFVLLSCKNDDQNIATVKLPKEITSIYSDVKFTYNSKGQLTQVVEKDTDNESNQTIFTYDDAGKLSKYVSIETNKNGVTTFSYSITYPSANEARIIDDNGEVLFANFDDKGNLTKVTYDDQSTLFTYDSKGNVVKIDDNESTTTISYNNNKGILSGIKSPKWILLLTDYTLFTYAVNNPVTINYITTNNNTTTTSSEKYSYPKEHIIEGYPTKMSVDYSYDNTSYNEVFTITY